MMFSLHTPASLYTTNCKTRREQRTIRKYDSRSSHQRIIRLQPLASDHTRTTGLKKEANRLPRVFQSVRVLLQKAY